MPQLLIVTVTGQ